MTFRVTSIGGHSMPWTSNACSSAARIVAPLSTKVPSQSKMASLFIASHFADRGDEIVPANALLTFERCSQIAGRLVLVELPGTADFGWIDLEANDRAKHRLELAGG